MRDPSVAWARPREAVCCDEQHVHVWRAPLDLSASWVQGLSQALEPEELKRAERFRSAEDRRRYMVARAALRTILARYLDRRPDQVRFSRGPHGKPLLAGECVRHGLRFSVAHSHELALYSVSRGRETGIDLERVRADLATHRIAERCFSLRTLAVLSSLPPPQFVEGFFLCWTRQEAYLKARGYGFMQGWHAVPDQESGWLLEQFRPAPGYVGALAVQGETCRIQWWDWLIQ